LKKWTLVALSLTPDGKTISLNEHDGSYSIRVDGSELMSTRQHASEETLGQLACAHLGGRRGVRVLVGGLGFGFTLRAVLAAVAPDATVLVAELLAAVIAWNRDAALPLAADALADPRVSVVEQDVFDAIRQGRGSYDGIVLDVDNGPDALSAEDNRRLYDLAGLQLVRAALRPAGRVAFWSAAPDAAFERLMARAGFAVEVRHCRSREHAGRRHTVFLGREA
jgi:spermidine synthase